MKTKTFLLAVILGATSISCSGEKTENRAKNTEESSSIELSKDLTGTWKITSIDGDGGISNDVKFVFKGNELTLDAGYYKDNVKMKSGNNKSMSYTDQNDVTWNFNYSVAGSKLTLENMFNNKVHATYTLEKE